MSERWTQSRNTLLRLKRAITVGKSGGVELTVIQLAALLEIATYVHTTISGLADRLGVEPSTATRCVDVLGAEGRRGKPGLGLVERCYDADDRRVVFVLLTDRGREALGLIMGEEF